MRDELVWAKGFVQHDPPRVLRSRRALERFVVFTDACLEDGDETAGIGMVAFRCRGSEALPSFFFSLGRQ